jgi:hypothetical protein
MVACCYCRYCLLLMMQRCLLRATRVSPLESIPILSSLVLSNALLSSLYTADAADAALMLVMLLRC